MHWLPSLQGDWSQKNCWREVPKEGPGCSAASLPPSCFFVLSPQHQKMGIYPSSFLTVCSDTSSWALGVFQKLFLSNSQDLGLISGTKCMVVDSNSPCLCDVRDLATHRNYVSVTSLAEFYSCVWNTLWRTNSQMENKLIIKCHFPL